MKFRYIIDRSMLRPVLLYSAAFWMLAPLAMPQVPISISPHVPAKLPGPKLAPTHQEKHLPTAGRPILGYALSPDATSVQAIYGTVKAPQMGDMVSLPTVVKQVYLPQRQHFALLEQTSGESVAVWPLHHAFANNENSDPVPVKGAMAHPDSVTFSPRGDSAVLYSRSTASLQLLSHLPLEPSLTTELGVASYGTPVQIAVSDDAAVVVVKWADGNSAFSLNGSAWRPLATSFNPQAWTFIPGTHDLAISDIAQKALVLLPAISEVSSASHVLAQGFQADRLAATKSGGQLIAANAATGQLWTIELKSGTATLNNGISRIDTLSALRNGFTFLLSTSPSLSLFDSTVSPASVASSTTTVGLAQDGVGRH